MKGENQQPKGEHIDAFVAAAHELKAPLVLMRHLTQALNDTALDLSPTEQKQHLERLYFTSERMMRLVQQLTLSYRIESDQQLRFAFQLEPLSVNEVCAQALHEMTPYAKQYRQELRLKRQHCPHLVLANRDILHDIVVNLIDNAIRHNTEGGVIQIAAHCKGERVRMRVHDNGNGILPSELARLHATLGKQPQPLNGRSATSGLGLYIAGQLAHAMGGSLGLGRARQGTTLFVDLLRSQQLSLL